MTPNPNARFHIAGATKPPGKLPKTGDGFPLWQLLAMMGCCLAAMGWVGWRMRAGRP